MAQNRDESSTEQILCPDCGAANAITALSLDEVKLGQDLWLWHLLPSILLVMMVAIDAAFGNFAHFGTLGFVGALVLLSARQLRKSVTELLGDVRYCVKCGHAFILEPRPPNLHLKGSLRPLGRELRAFFLKLYHRDSKTKKPPK